MHQQRAAGPLAVIAGGGQLPEEVIEAARASGRDVLPIAIQGEASASLLRFEPVELGWAQIGKLFDLLAKHQAKELVLIGSVSKRPDFTQVLGDFGTMRRLPKIIAALKGGDDSLLVKVMGLFEAEGIRVLGAHDVAPQLLAGSGLLAGPHPSDDALAELEFGKQALNTLADLDMGQALAVKQKRVLAAEAAEGTDLMISRVSELRQLGRIRSKGPAGVLVKGAKRGQDLRVDLPTIGPSTVRGVAAAQLQGLFVEAKRVLIAQKAETLRLANKQGVFIYGY
ncbi:LpxI family protein [Polycladidibacter hongkongensis]|uniref:LpxI family protein n=1 Tax=Polycladidibacter hongkongensis TaxID=1647556 RepID=UPI00082F0109|nr:UDP-2,3-diacylglucosamine diphosphatase LpxI [Pseudovibrio hongkongensis]